MLSATSKGWKSFTSWVSREAKDSGRKIKVANQRMKESMGKAPKTVDLELDTKLAAAKQTQKDYMTLISLLNNTAGTIMLAGKSQMALGECMDMLAGHDRSLRADFKCHATIQDLMSKNAAGLVEATSFFKDQVDEYEKKFVS